MNYSNQLQKNALEAVAGGLIVMLACYALYAIFEPAISYSQATTAGTQFETTLAVQDEITFLTAPQAVTLTPALSGITGGTANGGTQMVVQTNNSTGYAMTILASSTNMEANTSADNIPGITASSSNMEPTYTFDSTSVGSNNAMFGYTLEASTTFDLDQSFKNDASNDCNTGTLGATDQCWMIPTSTAPGFTGLNRATSTPSSGSTSTIKFRAIINPNPAPAISEDTYTSTTTITVTNNA